MAKAIPNAGLDLLADDLIANGNEMVLCSGEPADYTAAHTTLKLADVVLAGGDYTKGDHAPDGREVEIAAKSAVPVDANGTGTHVAITDTVNTVLKVVTTCTSVVVVGGGTFDFPAWKVILRDPV